MSPPGILPPVKLPRWKIFPQKIAPRKLHPLGKLSPPPPLRPQGNCLRWNFLGIIHHLLFLFLWRFSSVKVCSSDNMFIRQGLIVSLKFGRCNNKEWVRIKNAFFGFFLLLFIINFLFLSFPFLFLMNYQISTAEYQPIRNRNRWSKIVLNGNEFVTKGNKIVLNGK